MIHVCPLSKLEETVTATGARHVVTLVNEATPMTRPSAVAEADHLFLAVSDIVEAMDGHVVPAEEHLDRLLAFAAGWDRATPLVVHCYAGVSRSTAAAYVIACALDPARDEMEAALALRAASPTATPNRRIVALADARLGRDGRMVRAIEAIGRGADCFEGTPFFYRL
jgi:predicted protein tyrosine phosphatase